MLFGRTPIYRPSKQSTYHLISALCDGVSDDEQWFLFISMPILHDLDLEGIRLQCYELELQAEESMDVQFGSGKYRYNDYGMKCLEKIRLTLKLFIDNEPMCRLF